MVRGKQKNIKLTLFCIVSSILTLAFFHKPFLTYAARATEGGIGGVVIVSSLVILLLAVNFFASYLVLYAGRFFGRVLMALSYIINAGCLYFINSYDVLLDKTMMGNVFNTNTAEATGYYSFSFILYILLLGVIPAVWCLVRKIDFGSFRRFLANVGISLAVCLAVGLGNVTNWPWVDSNSTVIGSLLLPWSYIVNSFRFHAEQRRNNREEILLPDATIRNDRKEALVLVIGESARSDHFSIYGYDRPTNPRLSGIEGLKTYPAVSAATYTTGGVKAILDHKETSELYEILPNYLYRTGVDVTWRTSNWGQSPLHIDKYEDTASLAGKYPGENPDYDGIMLKGLGELISGSAGNKVLVVLHTSTSHGPSYEKRYPPEFEVFTPVNHCVEMSKSVRSELLNSYDNSILYTDWLLAETIDVLKGLEDWKTCMIFVSDHGESLGENKLYMHGVPISVAPREQYEIPFIVWTSDSGQKYKPLPQAVQYNVFHSVLHFLGIDSPVYDESLNIFAE